jgi:hypothetical protein
MAEPYVAIGQLTSYQTLMTNLEVTTTAASSTSTSLTTNINNVATYLTTTQTTLKNVSHPFLLGG